jgi:hypothetical protein
MDFIETYLWEKMMIEVDPSERLSRATGFCIRGAEPSSYGTSSELGQGAHMSRFPNQSLRKVLKEDVTVIT